MADRDENGQFLPGHTLKSPGRPRKEQELAVLHAITSALTPEEIKDAVVKALTIAINQNSARGIVAVLELLTSYAVGKPTQRLQVTGQDTLADVLEQLRSSTTDTNTP